MNKKVLNGSYGSAEELKEGFGILHKGTKVVDTFFKNSDPIAHQYMSLKPV
jgi:hypothetical protein